MRIIKSTVAGLVTNSPSTSIRRIIDGATKVPTIASSDASVLLMPIIAPKGPTDKLITFNGTYAEFVTMFGDYDTSKHGEPFKLVHEHIARNGRWVGMNMRAEDAKAANIVLCMTVTPVTKTIYVDTDGKVYPTQPVSTPTKEVALNTYSIGSSFQTLPNIKSLLELDLAVKPLTVMTSPNNMVMPFIGMTSNGRGKYGNNIELVIDKTSRILKTSIGTYSMYNLAIMDKVDNVVLEKHQFTHARDVIDGIGMSKNLGDTLDEYGGSLNHRQYNDNIDKFDDIFVTMLESIITQIVALKDAPPSADPEVPSTAMPELELLYVELNDLKTVYENNDNTIPAFNLIDPLGALPSIEGADTNIFQCIFKMPEDRVYQARLAGGDDGYLKKLKRFDWDFEAEVSGANTKALAGLYAKFFNGLLTDDIYDRNRCRADYVQDPDFPVNVKLAVDKYCSEDNRLDIQYILNAPISLSTVTEAKTFEAIFLNDNINRTKFLNNANMKDPRSGKWVRTPISIALTSELVSFYKQPLAPFAGRYIKGLQERSVVPNLTQLKDMDWCYENDWNYITEMPDGYMLDGNAGAFKGYDHPAKELYNQLWSNRLIKDMLDFLDKNRHKLQSVPLSVIMNDVENIVLKPYRNIGLTCSYTIGYADERDRKAGTLTDELTVEGPRTNKRHNLLYRLTNNN